MKINAERIGWVVIELSDGSTKRFYPSSISVIDNGRGQPTTLNIRERKRL